MKLSSILTDTHRIVTVEETRIDAAAAIQFKDAMRTETEEGPDRVILDLSIVDFIDSSGLGAIVASMKQMGRDRRFDLAGLTPRRGQSFSPHAHGHSLQPVPYT